MAKKKRSKKPAESFSEIATDLEPVAKQASQNVFGTSILLAFLIVMAFIMVYRNRYELQIKLEKTVLSSKYKGHLSDFQADSTENYAFNWELSDYDKLTDKNYAEIKGDSIADIVAAYGKAVEVDDNGHQVVLEYYTEDSNGPQVDLYFYLESDGDYHLESHTFRNFPLPEDLQEHFNAEGKPLTHEVFEGFKASDNSGAANLIEVLETFQKPTYANINLDDKNEKNIYLYYTDSQGQSLAILRFELNDLNQWTLVDESWIGEETE